MRICPNCGSVDTRRIAFGYPGPQMVEDEARGDIFLGGCFSPPSELGRWNHCMSCGHEFNDQTGQSIEDAYREYMSSRGLPND
jgi:hypothetical protein